MNTRLNFGGDPDHRLDTGIVFGIRHYREIRKVVSIDRSARRCSVRHALAGIAIATTTSYFTALGGGMHYPSASSFVAVFVLPRA